MPGNTGPQGPQGLQGNPVSFKGVWPTGSPYAVGDAVSYTDGNSYISLIANNTVTPGSDPTKWAVLAQAGSAATVSVGTTTTGAAGSSASVTNSGSTSAAILNFTVPQGPAGAPGSTGVTGPQGPAGTNGTNGTDAPVTFSAALNLAQDPDEIAGFSLTGTPGTLLTGDPGYQTGYPVAATYFPTACSMKSMNVYLDVTPSDDGSLSLKFTLRTGTNITLNGDATGNFVSSNMTSTAMTCTLSGATRTCSNTTPIAIAAGELADLRVDITGGNGLTNSPNTGTGQVTDAFVSFVCQ